MQVVILASGLGTRLRPLTLKTPKSMLPIKGKPFLEHQLELMKKNGFQDFVVCLAYLGDQIENYFGDGQKLGIKIVYSKGDVVFGTGGNIKIAENLLEDNFLLLYGDSFLDIDYQNLVSYFKKKGKSGVSVAFNNIPKITLNNMKVDENNQVINYNKKEEGDCNFVEAGVHAFKKDILNFIPAGANFSLEEDLFPVLIKREEMFAYPTDKRFYDIGTLERLKEFEKIT